MDKLVLKEDLKPVFDLLNDDDINVVVEMKEELTKTFNTAQIFRTETEMRVSVLNDHNLPDKASKYWQSVREQNSMFESIMASSFQLRRLEVKHKRLSTELDTCNDELRREEIQIEIDELMYMKANQEKTVKDRIREINMWSKIKSELDDGSFNTQDVNEHQLESYSHILENRVRALSPNASDGERLNAVGPWNTAKKYINDGNKSLQSNKQPVISNK